MSDQTQNIILFDDMVRDRLLPFTFIRPVAEIRMGILTIGSAVPGIFSITMVRN